MCNACGFACCAWDGLSGCGCDCEEVECLCICPGCGENSGLAGEDGVLCSACQESEHDLEEVEA